MTFSITIRELAQKNWKKLDTADSNAEFVACVECHCTECHNDKYRYPECCYAKCVIVSVIITLCREPLLKGNARYY